MNLFQYFTQGSKKPAALVVDDNPFNRELLAAIIEEQGFSVVSANNGKEAIEKIGKTQFQLIFMDLIMPGMDGYETTRKIREQGIKIPIIAVSSISFKQDKQRSFDSGCNDFLTKPVDIDELKKMIEKYIRYSSDSLNNEQENISEKFETSGSGLNFSNYSILFVEENEKLCKRYSNMLKKFGFGVISVSNGTKALELVNNNQNSFQIIISNIFTSGIDALGLLILVKREHPDIFMFIYTNKFDTDTFQLAIQHGVDGIIPQSQFEDSVLRMIELAIDKSKEKKSYIRQNEASDQIRHAQSQLIKIGCKRAENVCDIAYSSLCEAGGDMARCRCFNLDGRCGFMLADAAGHDVMSSYMSAIFLGMLSSMWDKNQDPMDLLKTLNLELNKLGHTTTHVCATALLLDRRRKKMKIATAGNPGGIILEKNEDGSFNFRELVGGGMCLGLLKEDHLFFEQDICFEKESYLFLFSDGIEKDQLLQAISSNIFLFSGNRIKGISQKILDYIMVKGTQNDDVILLCLYMHDEENESFHYQLRSTYDEVDKACNWLKQHVTPEKIPKHKDYLMFEICFREALLNALEHGNRYDKDAYIDVSLNFKPDELRIHVSDQGMGFDLSEKIKNIKQLNNTQIGGRGLLLMRNVADAIEINGGTVTLAFKEQKE